MASVFFLIRPFKIATPKGSMIYTDYNEFYAVDIKPSRLGISQLINATSYLSNLFHLLGNVDFQHYVF